MAMYHRPDITGKIRDVPVYIKGNESFKAAKLDDIEPKLFALLEKYNVFIRKRRHKLSEILEFAGYLHNEFQHIHPFRDGNSWTTRLITFHMFLFLDIPILDIPLGLLEEYLFATKASKKRDDKKLTQVLQKIILFNLKSFNNQLR